MVRRSLIIGSLLCLLGSVGGASLAGAKTVKRHHKRHHTSSVLRYMGPIPSPGIFGMDTNTYNHGFANWKRDTPTARSLGARWIHFTDGNIHFYGNGGVNWSTMDYAVKWARENHLGVLISFGGAARACSIRPRPTAFTGCPPTTSADLSAYKSFMRAEVLRYRNVVNTYESWVEPNKKASWMGGANPQQYANLLRAQYQVIQSINHSYHTHIKLLFGSPMTISIWPGSSPGTMSWVPFVHDVLADLHGARVFDGIALHAYRFPEYPSESASSENWGPDVTGPEYVGNMTFPDQGCGTLSEGWCSGGVTWSTELRIDEALFQRAGYGTPPLWITEFGWPGNANPSTALYPSFSTQATYLTEAYRDLLNLPFVQAAFWFNQRDYTPGVPNPDAPYFAHYGLLTYNFTEKPAAIAFHQLVSQNPGR